MTNGNQGNDDNPGHGGGNPGQGGGGNPGHGGGQNDDIKLEIATPNGVFRGTFGKNTKVEDVIKAVVADRHLSAGDTFELFFGEIQLTPVERPLVSFGLSGTVKLTLVAAGSGV